METLTVGLEMKRTTYVIFDNDANIDILPTDYETDEVMPRSSQDKIINANGRKLLDVCKLNTLRIANGRLGSDRGVGKYTYDILRNQK